MKKIITLILSVLMFFSVAACSVPQGSNGNRDDDLTNIVTDPDLKVVLKFRYFGDDVYAKLMNQLIAEFEEENPKTTISAEKFTGNYFATLLTDCSSGIEPDVFFMQPSEMAEFVKGDYLLPINYFLDKSTVLKKEDIFDVTFDSFSYDGKEYGKGNLYGIVKDWSPDFMLIYNKTLIDHARKTVDPTLPEIPYDKPLTWDEFEKIAKAVKKVDTSYSSEALNPPYYGALMDANPYELMVQYVLQNGGELFSSDFSKVNLEDAAVKEAIQEFVALQNGPDSAAPFELSLQQNTALTEFARGKNAMMFSGKWFFPAYITAPKPFEIGVALPPMPEGKEDNPIVMCSGLLGYSASKNTLYPDRAFQWIEFLMTRGVELFAENNYNIPGTKSAAEKMFKEETDENTIRYNVSFQYALDYVQVAPMNPYLSNTTFMALMKNKIEAVYGGTLTLEEALQAAKKEIEDIIAYNLL